MKIKIVMIMSFLVVMFGICACGKGTGNVTVINSKNTLTYSQLKDREYNSAKLNIVCCNFPEYDWMINITEGSDNVDVWLLVDDGTDIHSFQPSVDDMVKISSCDIFIYSGGETTGWMEESLKNAENENMTVINLLESPDLYVKYEDNSGIQEEHEHEEISGAEASYDEHVWLSLYNAQQACNYFTECLVLMDSENEQVYTENCEAYVEKLVGLDNAYRQVVDCSEADTVVFADRFPFKYLMSDYELNYYAAFPGCSTESDASFQTIIALAEKTDELGLQNVVVVDGSDASIAESVIENTTEKSAEIVTMYSMQSVSANDIDNGASYFDYMEKNLQALSVALNIGE